MKIRIETPVYNERRYSRPWIARVDFSSSLRGEFLFGQWLGRHGYTGELYVEAEPGDIVARGQKDLRNARNSAPSYYIVQDDGNLEHIGENPVDARRFYLEKKG